MLCHAEIVAEVEEVGEVGEEEMEDAKILAKALMPDDTDWCKSFFEGVLKIKIESSRVESVLSACEDYFRNLKAGIEVLRSIK